MQIANCKLAAIICGLVITASLCSAQEEPVRSATKRLSDYNLPGLEKTFNFSANESMDVVQVIYTLAHYGELKNIVIGKGVAGQTTKVSFDGVTIGDALEVILSVNNLAYKVENGIITITTDEEYQKAYGVSFYDKKKVKIVELKYADPSHVSEVLTTMKSAQGTIVSDKVTGSLILIDTPEKIQEMEAVIAKSDISTISRILPTETKTFVLHHAEIEDIQTELKELITPEVGSLRSNKRTKTLIVTDLPHKMEQISHLIESFDVRTKEVNIDARIVQVTLSDDYRMGVDWNHLFQGLAPRFSLSSTVAPKISTALGGVTSPGEGIGSLTYKTIVGGGDLSVIVDALKQIGETKILSNPHVAVMNGEEAEIATVREQPYASAQFESGSTNIIGETLTFIPVGVTLTVTPTISDDGMIKMDVKPEVSTIDGFYNAFYPIPIVKKAYTETTVMIKDGETIIIAGMIEDETREVKNSVPFIGRIPLVGMLFRSTTDLKEAREIIVFLTPRLMTGEEPMLRLKDEKKTPKPLRSTMDKEKTIRPVR